MATTNTTTRAQGAHPAGQARAIAPVDFTAPTAAMVGDVQAGDLYRRIGELNCLVRSAHALAYRTVRGASAGDVLEMEDVDAAWAPVYLLAQAIALLEAIEYTSASDASLGGTLGGAA